MGYLQCLHPVKQRIRERFYDALYKSTLFLLAYLLLFDSNQPDPPSHGPNQTHPTEKYKIASTRLTVTVQNGDHIDRKSVELSSVISLCRFN